MKCPNLDCPVRTRSCERFRKEEQEYGSKSCSTRTTEENEKRFKILFALKNSKETIGAKQP